MARDMVLITLDVSMFGQPHQRPLFLDRMPVDMASATEPARGEAVQLATSVTNGSASWA